MEKIEFDNIVATYKNIWTVDFDPIKIQVWYDILGSCKAKGLMVTIYELSKISKYPPTIAEILEKYGQLQQSQNKQKLASKKDAFALLVAKESRCILCNDTGYCSYFTNFAKDQKSPILSPSCLYEIHCRCTCSYGTSLNHFSQSHIDREYMKSHNQSLSAIKKAIYLPTIKEVVGVDFYNTLLASKKSKTYNVDKMSKADMEKYLREKVGISIITE